MADVCFSKTEVVISQPSTGNSIASIWASYRFIKLAAAAAQDYFRFRICWYRCLQKVKVYEQTKFCRHISIDGWDITTSVFWKTNIRYIGILLPVLISTTCMSFCITLTNFVQIGAPTAKIWRHFHFSRWRPRPLNSSSGFVFDVSAFRRSKSTSKPNFVDISQFTVEI